MHLHIGPSIILNFTDRNHFFFGALMRSVTTLDLLVLVLVNLVVFTAPEGVLWICFCLVAISFLLVFSNDLCGIIGSNKYSCSNKFIICCNVGSLGKFNILTRQ